MDLVWISCGSRVDLMWISCGSRVDLMWISCGSRVDLIKNFREFFNNIKSKRFFWINTYAHIQMESKSEPSGKIFKLQLFIFGFIYSLHSKGILTASVIMDILPYISSEFIASFTNSNVAIKKKYMAFLENDEFPFQRNIVHKRGNMI